MMYEEQLKQAKETLNFVLNMSIDLTPKIAEVYRTLFLELIKKGFTQEEALQIVIHYKPLDKNN